MLGTASGAASGAAENPERSETVLAPRAGEDNARRLQLHPQTQTPLGTKLVAELHGAGIKRGNSEWRGLCRLQKLHFPKGIVALSSDRRLSRGNIGPKSTFAANLLFKPW